SRGFLQVDHAHPPLETSPQLLRHPLRRPHAATHQLLTLCEPDTKSITGPIEPPTGDGAITVTVPKNRVNRSLDELADLSIAAALKDANPTTERQALTVHGVTGLAQEFERERDGKLMRWLTLFLLNDGRFAAITANGTVDAISRDRASYEKTMRS